MRALKTIYLRELTAYFYSPIAYVLLVGFLALTGYFFYSGVAFYALASLQMMQNPMMMQMNLQDHLLGPLLMNTTVVLMLITPLLTMRLLAEEKRTGTMELLLSYPLGDMSVVLGKFLAAWTFFALMVVSSWLHLAVLASMAKLAWTPLAVGYLGLLLMGGAFISLGLWASALTDNQIVAAVAGFAALLLAWAMGWTASVAGPTAGPLLNKLSLGTHFENFPKGLIDTADLAYFVLFIGFFLFLSIRTLEAKRWKA
ncbi:MAG: ABC transporter permease [Desulfarculus sp.]|jgi:ABC-2 type transport system permease protein|nr:MAG: ABC transporter permease [Desulfarculus sp.]